MELELWRYNQGVAATLGVLMMNRFETRELLCFTVEDVHRSRKIQSETRIPAGRYEIELRTTGGMHARYGVTMGEAHHGMLWLRQVPGFSFVYFHVGNDADDTAGCILLGENRSEAGHTIQQSRAAYKRVYPRIAQAVRSGGAWVTILDLDRPTLPTPPVIT